MTHQFLQFLLSPLFSCTNAHRLIFARTAVAASYQLTLSCQRPIRITEHMPSSCQRCLALCFGSIILIVFFSVGRKFIRHGARVSHSISQSIAYELIFVVSIIFTFIANAWRKIVAARTHAAITSSLVDWIGKISSKRDALFWYSFGVVRPAELRTHCMRDCRAKNMQWAESAEQNCYFVFMST